MAASFGARAALEGALGVLLDNGRLILDAAGVETVVFLVGSRTVDRAGPVMFSFDRAMEDERATTAGFDRAVAETGGAETPAGREMAPREAVGAMVTLFLAAGGAAFGASATGLADLKSGSSRSSSAATSQHQHPVDISLRRTPQALEGRRLDIKEEIWVELERLRWRRISKSPKRRRGSHSTEHLLQIRHLERRLVREICPLSIICGFS